MTRLALVVAVVASLATGGTVLVGCGASVDAIEDLPAGTEVEITTHDGEVVEGALVAVDPDEVIVESDAGEERTLRRETIARVERGGGSAVRDWFSFEPDAVNVTMPAGTTIPLTLETPLSSKTAAVEDRVRAITREPVSIDGRVVIPAGSVAVGNVTEARPSGDVKGRARLGVRFTEIDVRGERHDIVSRPLVYQAEGTKKEDAAKIGIGAAAGAIIGGIADGGKGAAVGSVIGGGAGAAVVLMTPGDEVSLPSRAPLTIELTQPVEVSVPLANEQ